MSCRLADGTFSTDYTQGDKFVVVQNSLSCNETTAGEVVILDDDDGTFAPFFIAADGSGSGERCCCWEELEKYTEHSLPTYTTQELSYIEELEDEVNRLNDLCSDYMKIVEEKDAEIFQLKHQALRVDNETVLGVEQQFKPIYEMTISDWQQALKECWEFEDNEGDVCVVEGVDSEKQLVNFDEYIGAFDVNGRYCDNVGYDYYIAKRIK